VRFSLSKGTNGTNGTSCTNGTIVTNQFVPFVLLHMEQTFSFEHIHIMAFIATAWEFVPLFLVVTFDEFGRARRRACPSYKTRVF
jgi:hypothetical protein